MNAELQRIAKRDKKAFLNDQHIEIQENNRMGKTRDLLKKIRDTKGTFHANEVKVTQSCLTLCDPMDYLVYGILQTRILEWVVAFPFSRGSSQPRDRTQVSHMAGGCFTSWATGSPIYIYIYIYMLSLSLSLFNWNIIDIQYYVSIKYAT